MRSVFEKVVAYRPRGAVVQPAVRILFVDDDPGILLTLSQVLRISGYDVVPAATVPEALTLMHRRSVPQPVQLRRALCVQAFPD